MKKQKCFQMMNVFDLLSEEIVFEILDCLSTNPVDRKSFSLVCKSFYIMESKHRKKLRPLRQEHLQAILTRYPNISHLDLSLCPRVTDNSLKAISRACDLTLRSVDLSRSGAFSGSGLLSLTVNCKNLVEIDISNAVNLKDAGAAALAEAKNLEKLWMGRCKMVTDIGVGCIAVGCKKLRLISLKWCLGVGDLGVGLIAVKCKEIRSLDLSYLPVSFSFVVYLSMWITWHFLLIMVRICLMIWLCLSLLIMINNFNLKWMFKLGEFEVFNVFISQLVFLQSL